MLESRCVTVHPTDERKISLFHERGLYKEYKFSGCVFDEYTGDSYVQDAIAEPLLKALLERKQNCTLLAYGERATGKSYTLGTLP